MKTLVRVLSTSLLFGAAAGCALVAGIEDFHGVPPGTGDEGGAVLDGATFDDAASGDAWATSDGPFAADADGAAADAPLVLGDAGCAGACAPTQTCVQGTCYPQAIATGRTGASTIVVVGSDVDWVESNLGDSVVSCPATGCTGTPTVLVKNLVSAVLRRASPQGMPTLIQVDQGAANAQGITSANALTQLTSDDHVVGAAASGGGVLWGSRDKVRFCATTPCSSPVALAFNTTPPTGTAMEILGSTALWTPPNGGVVSCALPSCTGSLTLFAGTTVVDFEADANGVVALTSSQLLFADGGPPVASLPVANGVGMVMDASTVYVAAPGAIYAVDRASPSLVTRWPVKKPGGLAMDASFLYWTDGSSVLRAPK